VWHQGVQAAKICELLRQTAESGFQAGTYRQQPAMEGLEVNWQGLRMSIVIDPEAALLLSE
jgi:hypothetical protein